MRLSLEHSDRLIHSKNQEIEKLRSELIAANEEIENLDNQLTDLFKETPQDAEIQNLKSEIERLKSELAERSQTPAENSVATGKLEELQENSEINFDFAGKAGELVSWLRKTVGKALPKQVTVKEIQKILEGGDN